MTPEYIMAKSLCREPHCADGKGWQNTAKSCIECMDYAAEYAEPGYDNPAKGILFCNWNYFPTKVADLLEGYGFSIEWEDEWTRCDGCGKAVRTSADSYGWQPSYLQTEGGECYCVDCLDADDIEPLENEPDRALNLRDIDPAKYGYAKVESGFESGWYPGQNDNPREIFDRLKAAHPRLLFVIDSTGQFDLGFSVWEREPLKANQ